VRVVWGFDYKHRINIFLYISQQLAISFLFSSFSRPFNHIVPAERERGKAEERKFGTKKSKVEEERERKSWRVWIVTDRFKDEELRAVQGSGPDLLRVGPGQLMLGLRRQGPRCQLPRRQTHAHAPLPHLPVTHALEGLRRRPRQHRLPLREVRRRNRRTRSGEPRRQWRRLRNRRRWLRRRWWDRRRGRRRRRRRQPGCPLVLRAAATCPELFQQRRVGVPVQQRLRGRFDHIETTSWGQWFRGLH